MCCRMLPTLGGASVAKDALHFAIIQRATTFFPHIKNKFMIDLGEAHSLADLIAAAHSAEEHFKDQVWFRGHADYGWKLVPGAHRRHPILEAQFANHFRIRAPAFYTRCPQYLDYSSWLPLMQHYGLPTRLLDWTESLLVAAFFAVSASSVNNCAAIWMLSPGKLNAQCSELGDFIPFLTDSRVKRFVTSAFNVAEPSDLSLQHSISVLAPRTDSRMTAQLGNYTIHGDRQPLETHTNSCSFLARVSIPEKSCDKIRTDLSVSGIRLSSLFPDLINLAKEIADIWALDSNGADLEISDE